MGGGGTGVDKLPRLSPALINDYMYKNVLFSLCHLLITLANGLDQDKDRRSCKKLDQDQSRQAVCHSDIVSEKVNF